MTLIIFFMGYLCGPMGLGLPIACSLLFGSVATALHMGGTATNPQIVATQLLLGVDSVSMMAPVSYTHLDVYKRQPLMKIGWMLSLFLRQDLFWITFQL